MKVILQGKGELNLTQRDYVAEGGQGKIFQRGGTAYKVYHDPAEMIPMGKFRELSQLPTPPFIRPQELLLDPNSGKVIGYTSPFVDDAYVLCQLFPRAFRDRMGLTHKHTFALAERLRDAMQTAHQAKILLVDPNEMNFLVDKTFRSLACIDTDSYQTPSYPATAIMDTIRDRHMAHPTAFDEGTDWFSFAIVAFQLLVGIHPYKGKHPTLKGWDARMKANVSVFHPNVSVPTAAYDFGVIPKDWRAWFEAVFDRGERAAPPGGALQVAMVRAKVRELVGAGLLQLTQLAEVEGTITNVWAFGHSLLVATTEGLFLDGRKLSAQGPFLGAATHAQSGTIIAAYLSGDHVQLFNTATRLALPLASTGSALSTGGGDLFFKNGGEVRRVTLAGSSRALAAGSVPAASVLPHASQLFPGCVLQSLLGASYANILQADRSYQIRLPELDGYRVIDAKWDSGARGGALVVVGHKQGQTDRLVFRFDAAFGTHDVRKTERVGSTDINFVVTDRGVAVLLDSAEERLELFAAHMGSPAVKVVDDPVIGGDMRLFKRDQEVLVARGSTLYTMKMS